MHVVPLAKLSSTLYHTCNYLNVHKLNQNHLKLSHECHVTQFLLYTYDNQITEPSFDPKTLTIKT